MMKVNSDRISIAIPEYGNDCVRCTNDGEPTSVSVMLWLSFHAHTLLTLYWGVANLRRPCTNYRCISDQ